MFFQRSARVIGGLFILWRAGRLSFLINYSFRSRLRAQVRSGLTKGPDRTMETPRESDGSDFIAESACLTRRRFVIADGAPVAVAGLGPGSVQAAAVTALKTTDAMPAADGAKAPRGTWLAGDTHLPVWDQIAQSERGPASTSRR